MNDTLDVTTCFRGSNVFITGSTGFIGKALLHKLLSACDVHHVYLLLRPKKGQDPQQRLCALLKLGVFKELAPDLLSRVHAVCGDMTMPGLGLKPQDLRTIRESVSFVFHSAATVKFDEELPAALTMNVEGTRTMLELASTMEKLRAFVHVSTAYAHVNRKVVGERLYLEEEALSFNKVAAKVAAEASLTEILGEWPNTYTFTKAMAEQLLQEYSKQLPLAVVRPSIVVAADKEPMPGWVDNLNGPTGEHFIETKGSIRNEFLFRSDHEQCRVFTHAPHWNDRFCVFCTGMIAGAGVGLLRTLHVLGDKVADLVPVDCVIDVMVTAAAAVATPKESNERPLIVNCTSGQTNPMTWGDLERLGLLHILRNPFENVVWYPGGHFRRCRRAHKIAQVLFHHAPAFVADALLFVAGRPRFVSRVVAKMERAAALLEYFTTRDWKWDCHNMCQLMQRASPDFAFDLQGLDWNEFMGDYVRGVRRFVLKQEPSTLDRSRTRLFYLKIAHFGTQALALAFFICMGSLLGRASGIF